MEEITSLREEVKIMLDKADEKTIRMMYAMLEAGAEEDWWNSMPDEIQTQVEEAIEQGDRGEGISDEEVKKKYAKWFVK